MWFSRWVVVCVAWVLLGCSSGDVGLLPARGTASSSSSTTGGGGADAGVGGSGGAAAGSGGSDAGQGGAACDHSGDAGHCPAWNCATCSDNPAGYCNDVDDGCGTVDCSASCGPDMACNALKRCECPAVQDPQAKSICGAANPVNCGPVANKNTPAGCKDSGVSLFSKELWCCQ